MPRWISGAVLLAMTAWPVSALAAPQAAGTWTVAASSPAHYRLGSLRFDGDPFRQVRKQTLRTAIRAFGTPSSCKVGVVLDVAAWSSLGLRGFFTTFGGYPNNGKPRNACAQPAWVYPDHYDLYGSLWHTARGIGKGSTLAQLLNRYPDAERHGSDYWLSTRPTPWGGPHSHWGLLIAHTSNGRVSGLELSLQAQGE